MSNKQVAFNPGSLPAEIAALFDVSTLQDDLTAGVEGGFSVVSFRGKTWRIKHGGEEVPVTDDNDNPIPGLEVVILKASKDVSKIYYAKKYSEGDEGEPDCYSLDGIRPDSGANNKQASGCAACPHNQWGSRITDNGKKAKACSDNRRIAVEVHPGDSGFGIGIEIPGGLRRQLSPAIVSRFIRRVFDIAFSTQNDFLQTPALGAGAGVVPVGQRHPDFRLLTFGHFVTARVVLVDTVGPA